jgi:hypothetical protein
MRNVLRILFVVLRVRTDVGVATDMVAPVEHDIARSRFARIGRSHGVHQVLQSAGGVRLAGRRAARSLTATGGRVRCGDLDGAGRVVLVRGDVGLVRVEHELARLRALLGQHAQREQREVELGTSADQEAADHLLVRVPCVLHCDLHILLD